MWPNECSILRTLRSKGSGGGGGGGGGRLRLHCCAVVSFAKHLTKAETPPMRAGGGQPPASEVYSEHGMAGRTSQVTCWHGGAARHAATQAASVVTLAKACVQLPTKKESPGRASMRQPAPWQLGKGGGGGGNGGCGGRGGGGSWQSVSLGILRQPDRRSQRSLNHCHIASLGTKRGAALLNLSRAAKERAGSPGRTGTYSASRRRSSPPSPQSHRARCCGFCNLRPRSPA